MKPATPPTLRPANGKTTQDGETEPPPTQLGKVVFGGAQFSLPCPASRKRFPDRTACATRLLPLLLLLTLPAAVQGQFNYTTDNGTITITGYTGPGGAVTIPSTINGLPVTTIGDYAFQFAAVTSLTIPNSVSTIGHRAFQYCASLTAMTVDAINPAYSSVDGVLFDKSQTALLQYPGGKGGSYTIPNSVINIGSYAFSSCASLTNVTIPNSVTHIGNEAFSICTSLTGVTIPNSVTHIGYFAFGACTGLTSVTIGDSVTNIGDFAFSGCTSLTNVTIPNSVTHIGDVAFSGCTSLTNVTIPNSVTRIEEAAFAGCTSLTRVYFTGNAPSLGSFVFYGDDMAIVHYLPGTTGWSATFGGRPTALWSLPYPLILNNSPSFGVQTNGFGFIISWATNLSVVVEACTNLANPIWSPVGTNPLTGGSSYFSDPRWTNYPARFYRLRAP